MPGFNENFFYIGTLNWCKLPIYSLERIYHLVGEHDYKLSTPVPGVPYYAVAGVPSLNPCDGDDF